MSLTKKEKQAVLRAMALLFRANSYAYSCDALNYVQDWPSRNKVASKYAAFFGKRAGSYTWGFESPYEEIGVNERLTALALFLAANGSID